MTAFFGSYNALYIMICAFTSTRQHDSFHIHELLSENFLHVKKKMSKHYNLKTICWIENMSLNIFQGI